MPRAPTTADDFRKLGHRESCPTVTRRPYEVWFCVGGCDLAQKCSQPVFDSNGMGSAPCGEMLPCPVHGV
jgi:hypothetical protein